MKRGRRKQLRQKDMTKDRDIAYDFATKLYKQFKEIVKTVVLFGSLAKDASMKKSDIDLIVIVDDCTVTWDQELIAWYREELGKLLAKQKYKDKLHVSTVTLSTFWQEVRAGEPLIINILRYGDVLLDFGGFFAPLRVLLARGRIRPTPEAVFTTMKRAPDHLFRANTSILGSIEGFYWAMVDASHAALMAINAIPPSPEHIDKLLYENFVKNKQLDKKYIDWYKEVFDFAKRITHGDVRRVKGSQLDEYQRKADEFVKVLRDLAVVLIKREKIVRMERKKI